jgi:chromosome segregation ATPase
VLSNEQYKNKINSLEGNEKAIEKEQQFIRVKIETLNKEIAQYENNISFFGKGKGTEPIKKQVEQQIDKANKEIEDLKEKMQFLRKA